MAVDTIFLCFCEDSDRNDGVNRPYYMSTGLMVRKGKLSARLRYNCRPVALPATTSWVFDSILLYSSNFCPTVRRL